MQAQLQGAEAKEAVRQALAAELGREREEAEEMERIRQELAEEELQNRERQREKRDMEVRGLCAVLYCWQRKLSVVGHSIAFANG